MRGTKRVIFALLAALCLLPATAAAKAKPPYTVTSGPLTAEISRGSWGLRFLQPGKGNDLTQSGAHGAGPTGALGFQTADRWYHATKVLSAKGAGKQAEFSLATNDPAGRKMSATVVRLPGGAIRVQAAVLGDTAGVLQTGIAFQRVGKERYLGFGERSDQLDRKGTTTENYVGEGPYQESDYAIVNQIVPPWSIHDRRDASYFPMPWLLSTRGFGFLLGNTETSYFRVGTDVGSAWSVEAASPRLDFRVFAGPKPKDVLKRLTDFTGRQPKPLAPWELGPWFQTGQPSVVPTADEESWADALRDGDAPVSVAETHMRYLPCDAIAGNEDYERNRVRWWHENGFANITYVQEKVCSDYTAFYSAGLAAGAFLKHPDGSVYNFNAFVGDHNPPSVPMGQIDFSAKGAQGFYDTVLDQIVDYGHDGWMEDFGESIPPDSKAANGEPGTSFHNEYPVLYHRAGWQFAKRQSKPIVRFQRSGWTGVHPYAQIVWGGDPTTSWGFDGLSSAVTEGLSMGLSGIGIWASDIGGYFTFPGSPQLTPELLIRWIQFGSVSGVMRTKGTGQAIPSYQRPQIWEPEVLPYWRRYAKLRTQLYPYLAAAIKTYRKTGMPMMRQLSLVFGDDAKASAQGDEYMFGPDLLAAPVLEPGATTRKLYLPKGRWVNFWDAVHYTAKNGSYDLAKPKLVKGGRTITVPAPLAEMPLFVRAGGALPLLPADIDTLAPFGEEKGLVHLKDRKGKLRLLLFPHGRSTRAIGYDGKVTMAQTGRGVEISVSGGARTQYTLEVACKAGPRRLSFTAKQRTVSLRGC